jgi:hypothetical protein
MRDEIIGMIGILFQASGDKVGVDASNMTGIAVAGKTVAVNVAVPMSGTFVEIQVLVAVAVARMVGACLPSGVLHAVSPISMINDKKILYVFIDRFVEG